MKVFLTYLAALISLPAVVFPGYAQSGELDQVILVVNSQAITSSEYKTLALIQNPESTEKPQPVLGTEPTISIVNDQLILGRARALGMKDQSTKQDISNAIDKIAQQNKLAADVFLSSLSSKGIDLNIFRNSLKDRLLIERFVQGRVARSIFVSDADVKSFLDNNAALLKDINDSATEYELLHLLLPLQESLTENQLSAKKQLAEQVQQQLQSGVAVSEILQSNPEITASSKDAYLGWKAPAQLPDVFVNALADAEIDKVLPVVASPNGLHIIKLLNKRGAEQATRIKEYDVRHILLIVKQGNKQDEALILERIQKLRERLINGESFPELATDNSQDPGSRRKAGALGWVQADTMVPAFSEAIKTLPLNQISQPILSQFGYHLVEVLGQRLGEKGPTQVEAKARQLLFSQRIDEKMQEFINDMRQVAYIEVIQ